MELNPGCYQTIVESLSSGVLLLDEECRIQLWNDFMVEHSGKAQSDAIGVSLFEIFPDITAPWFQEQVTKVLKLDEMISLDGRMRPHLLTLNSKVSPNGTGLMYQDCDLIPVENKPGLPKLVCMVIVDVTASALYQLKLDNTLMNLEKISRLDGLTDLYNRGYWEGRLREEFARSKRYPDNADMTLLMFDVDHFKKVNDQYGHLAGDAVLKELSALVQDMFRNIDIPGRYGGEEFAIILPKTSLNGAIVVATRLLEAIAKQSVSFRGNVINVTVSIGLAEFNIEMKSYQDLIAAADGALYEAKGAGRNQIKINKPA